MPTNRRGAPGGSLIVNLRSCIRSRDEIRAPAVLSGADYCIEGRKNMAISGGKLVWTGRVLSVLSALPFLMSGVMKLKGGPDLNKGMEHLGLPGSMVIPLALLELTCVIGYLVPMT